MPEYYFKTIYFPKDRVNTGKSQRINLSFKSTPKEGYPQELITHIRSLSSRDFRLAIGDPILENLEKMATVQNRSLSNICMSILKSSFTQSHNSPTYSNHTTNGQQSLNFEDNSSIEGMAKVEKDAIGVTFKDSLRKGAFGWYPYVEGFSATYTRDALLRYDKQPKAVYDPFGGSGTTQLAASMLNINSFYSELNPFMAYIAETKVHASAWAKSNYKSFEKAVDKFISLINAKSFNEKSKNVSLDSYHEAFPNRNFFEHQHLKDLLAAMEVAVSVANENEQIKKLLLCACVANAVASSNMTRRADLRRRRSDEYKNRVVNVPKMVVETIIRMKEDINTLPLNMAKMEQVSADAKEIPAKFTNAFDFVLTSPPYLNGTNYFRNTKIELWLLSFIASEKELRAYREQTVTGGINDVSKKEQYRKFNSVEKIAQKLDVVSKDKRIPKMVRHYFSDMSEVFDSIFKGLNPEGKLLLDIGDSKFYGVHVPTDKLLIDVAVLSGFKLISEHVLARRVSRDKSRLVQVELVFEKQKTFKKATLHQNEINIKDKISLFQEQLPYKHLPYSKKNWGNKLHSLCSYQGKLKPAMAHWLIEYFVPEGGSVLDPIGGVGTIPFEAALKGLRTVSNDKSPFAAQIAKSKLNPPKLSDLEKFVSTIKKEVSLIRLTKSDIKSSEFGLNATVADYYHKETLKELLKLRKLYLIRDIDIMSDSESFFWACLLHILHGNRPYALSRTSHPITPFSPSGEAVFKDVYTKIIERAQRALKDQLPAHFRKGKSYYGDFRELPKKLEDKFDVIITSPPFYGMRFDRPNWLRLWFCGWTEKNFNEDSLQFLERQQVKDLNVYTEFFDMCYKLLEKNGLLIIHLGAGGRRDMSKEFKTIVTEQFSFEGEVLENVQAISKHGIKDKGYTKAHSLLFFKPKG